MSRFVPYSLLFAGLSACVSANVQTAEPNLPAAPLEERVPEQYKEGVVKILDVRKFAIESLGFEKNSKHYTWFTEEQDEHALAILSITKKTILPVSRIANAVSLSQNGSYRENVASFLYLSSHQDQLTDENDYYVSRGYDTYWRSVTNYHSSDDKTGSPITPSFLNSYFLHQAQTVIHEMCHEFVEHNIGDFPAELDESFCNLAGDAGALKYFTQKNPAEGREAANSSLHWRLNFAQKFNESYERLSDLYRRDISFEEKMERRQKMFAEIQPFMSQETNNASLWSWHPYLTYYPLFFDAYESQGGNIQKFIAEMKYCPEKKEKALKYIRDLSK